MKNEKTIGFLKVLVAVLAFVGFAYLGYKSINEVKLGLDLAGGVSITYQAVEENPSAEQMSDTIYKLQQILMNLYQQLIRSTLQIRM